MIYENTDLRTATDSPVRNRFQSGQVAVFQYSGRTSPAIAVQNSASIHIDHVTQYHAGAIANVENLEFYDNEIQRGEDYPLRSSLNGDFQFGAGATTGRL